MLEALRRRPVRHRVVLELYYREALTSTEIAEALELPEGTIRSPLRRARAVLERALGEVAEDPKVYEATRSDLDGWAARVRSAFRV